MIRISKICAAALLFSFLSFSQGQVTNVTIEVDDLDLIGLRFLFNHGAGTDIGNCTEADLTLFSEAINSQVMLLNRRGKMMRSLPTLSANCKQLCAGYASGTCLVPNCKGYRRLDVAGDPSEVLFFDSNGVISESSPSFLIKCAEEKEEAALVISGMTSELSPSCQELLLEPLDIQCFMYLN